ncbi:hypothetical protein GIY62_14720 [Burkholderia plantarii]|uniref:hypothetical protein n=1 Tax=Burkholderia plantarii TaxID=41899 RepID=UPI00272D2220|nr:hypothetical protein [Burkholderia plantarii]WLE58380.1 hypothetical protein GIY62_14720 [Burkholderia plantarii]
MTDPTPSQSGAAEMQASEPQTQAQQDIPAGPGAQPDIVQAVAASNASTVASLSTALSSTEASNGGVSSEPGAAPLSTSIAPVAQGAPAALGESVGGTASTSGSAIGGSPALNSSSSATAAPSTVADPDTGSIPAQPVATTADASSDAGDALSLVQNDSVSESNLAVLRAASAPVVPAPDPVTPLAPGAPQATPNTTADADVAFPAAMLARLHADLDELERKIGQGIHVFAHEVAAIRDRVKSLI